MSIYSVLSTPVPTIAYAVLYQSLGEVQRDEYASRLREFSARVLTEAQAVDATLQRALREAVAKEAQTLRGVLSQFLQTPISSDDQEVRRLIRESLEKFREQVADDKAVGLRYASDGRILFPSLKRARDKRLLQNGRLYLQQLGLDVAKDKGEIFESLFVLQGGTNLDVLDHILAEKIPQGGPLDRGFPMAESRSVHSVYNLLFAKGDGPGKSSGQQSTEAVIAIHRPEMMYAPFGGIILEMVQKMTAELLFDSVSLWRRKLGLGPGAESVLRIIVGRTDLVSEGIHWIDLHKEHEVLREEIIEKGNLYVKELVA